MVHPLDRPMVGFDDGALFWICVMTTRRTAIRAALVQQLQTDRLLGVRQSPLTLTKPVLDYLDCGRASEQGFELLPASAVVSGDGVSVFAAVADGEKGAALSALDEKHVVSCSKCLLCKSRNNTVFGAGNPNARLVFVGEAPGFEEDRKGVPFVGRAGELLTKMIEAMGLTREDVFICNVLKCRPPNNRDPAAEEIAACSPYLLEQLSIIHPEVIVALGSPASRTLLNTSTTIGRLRGRFHDYGPPGTPMAQNPIPLMPTYHPAYLLRSPGEKGKTWSDLKLVMARLGL